jgi:hypothetical protein
MTTTTPRTLSSNRNPSRPTPPEPGRRDYRERDFGVGYGRSSGYASTRQYATRWNGQPRFRCV